MARRLAARPIISLTGLSVPACCARPLLDRRISYLGPMLRSGTGYAGLLLGFLTPVHSKSLSQNTISGVGDIRD